jgi:hypothetical protein
MLSVFLLQLLIFVVYFIIFLHHLHHIFPFKHLPTQSPFSFDIFSNISAFYFFPNFLLIYFLSFFPWYVILYYVMVELFIFTGDSLPSLTFDKLLWMGYFRLAVTFITSPLVQVDVLKRQASRSPSWAVHTQADGSIQSENRPH